MLNKEWIDLSVKCRCLDHVRIENFIKMFYFLQPDVGVKPCSHLTAVFAFGRCHTRGIYIRRRTYVLQTFFLEFTHHGKDQTLANSFQI